MSHVVMIDLDEVAELIRENLDLALPHVTNQANVNPKSALKTVTAQWSYADMILRNLDDKYVHEIERFENLRREARDLIKLFWDHYSLFPIELSNGKVAQAQVVNQPTAKHINGRKIRKGAIRLSDNQKREITTYYDQLGHSVTMEDYAVVMETYNISLSVAKHLNYDRKRA